MSTHEPGVKPLGIRCTPTQERCDAGQARATLNELFVICAACSNRGGNSRISRNVTGLSSLFLFTLLIERGMPIASTAESDMPTI